MVARLVLLLTLLLLASPAGAYQKHSSWSQDTRGNAIPSVTITVYDAGTTTLSTIYSDNAGTSKSNPFTSDSTSGSYWFYAANGRYDIKLTKTGYTFAANDTYGITLYDHTSPATLVVKSYTTATLPATCTDNTLAVVSDGTAPGIRICSSNAWVTLVQYLGATTTGTDSIDVLKIKTGETLSGNPVYWNLSKVSGTAAGGSCPTVKDHVIYLSYNRTAAGSAENSADGWYNWQWESCFTDKREFNVNAGTTGGKTARLWHLEIDRATANVITHWMRSPVFEFKGEDGETAPTAANADPTYVKFKQANQGRVGIGESFDTNDPDVQLHLRHNTTPEIRFQSVGGTNDDHFTAGYAADASPLPIFQVAQTGTGASTRKFVLEAASPFYAWFKGYPRLGVNTIAPESTLHLSSSTDDPLTRFAWTGASARAWTVGYSPSVSPNAAFVIEDKTAAAGPNVLIENAGHTYFLANASGNLAVGLNPATSTPDQRLHVYQSQTITGGVTDGYSAALVLQPIYTAATAQTVTRHNYMNIKNVSGVGAGPAAITDSALFRFDAALGTHNATTNTDKTGNTKSGTIKVNVNGTLYHIQLYAN